MRMARLMTVYGQRCDLNNDCRCGWGGSARDKGVGWSGVKLSSRDKGVGWSGDKLSSRDKGVA